MELSVIKTGETVWEKAPGGLVLKPDEIHMWMASQNQRQAALDNFWKTLSGDERARAERFRFPKDRNQFIVSHGILRQLLGSYLQVAPAEVSYQYSAYGKPFLAEDFYSSHLRFNLSHSGETMLLGFTRGRELGVDIERIRQDFATLEIARAYFSPQENFILQALPKPLQPEAFFNCWTRKEAFIKAIGEGVSCPLDRFDVTLAPGEPAKLLATRLTDHPVSKWSMVNLEIGPDYKAAVVTERGEWHLKCWKWDARLG